MRSELHLFEVLLSKLDKGHFTVVYLVAKLLILNEAKGDLVVIQTSI